MKSILSTPWYSGCPFGKMPYMPVAKNSRGLWLFMSIFVFIYITQLIIVEPKLNVWYFLLSTTLISLKLLMSFIVTARSDPGYAKENEDIEFTTLMTLVPSKKLCPDCKVIKAPGTKHCTICNKCVPHYETHCVWLDTCIGAKNNGRYFWFVFYVWLDVFLIGWISMASIGVTECIPIPGNTCCPYTNLCLFDLCSSHGLHYFITYFDMLICYFFFVPSCWLCCRQCYNFGKGKTTNERYSRQKKRTPSVADTDDATSLITGNDVESTIAAREKKSSCACFFNCKRMCCGKRTIS